MFLLSSGMLFGLRTRRTKLLLSWVLLNCLLICPEAGMVLFMAIFHWDGATEGIIELGMWILRVLFNVAGMICTQSLYVHWRNEKNILRYIWTGSRSIKIDKCRLIIWIQDQTMIIIIKFYLKIIEWHWQPSKQWNGKFLLCLKWY